MNHEQDFFEQCSLGRADEELSNVKKAFLLVQEGALFAVAGDYTQATASYDIALEIQPNNFYIWDVRGDALRNLSRYEEAVASYDKALDFIISVIFKYTIKI